MKEKLRFIAGKLGYGVGAIGLDLRRGSKEKKSLRKDPRKKQATGTDLRRGCKRKESSP